MTNKEIWFLDAPSTAKRAEWDESQVRLATVCCAVNSGHQRAGKRLTSLEVVLKEEPLDFLWTWNSELLLRSRVVDLLRSLDFTGFELRPAKARFEAENKEPPLLWELSVIGWGGVARQESGIRLDEAQSCPTCGLLVYTALRWPDRLFDEVSWDGSDFFMIWPLPQYVFLTERVANALRDNELTGAVVRPLTAVKTSGGFTPGRLSYWMSDERAQYLGARIGIT